MKYLDTPGHDHFAVIEAMTEPANLLSGIPEARPDRIA
jgi:hypothetical protein